MDCPLQVGNEALPQVKDFKYVGVLFSSEGTMEPEMGRRIGAAVAVLQSLYCTVVTKRELSQKAKHLRMHLGASLGRCSRHFQLGRD
ncbi:hypothetical protein PBY51_019069 [Eleginops maclovinus]|uniref:Uncharacterized protein n=1 Tax=Eleginops maclovinus TaxID=56733 RepID=A0AAN8AT14_ELEMC|nr:hypothetical protein PBY51_019069 [Eleginops maclovinus]